MAQRCSNEIDRLAFFIFTRLRLRKNLRIIRWPMRMHDAQGEME
jgi:hypothetical protein